MTTASGVELIAAERLRQVSDEGWSAEHDDGHSLGQLAQAAACYAWPSPRPLFVKKNWPWDRCWFKPEQPDIQLFEDDRSGHTSAQRIPETEWRRVRVRTLVKAGALIAAEIDRLQRALAADPQEAAKNGK